ncbi:transglycosylase SLT domain-containing protein [Photobacterium leiognathi]|uniref:transglycosylase SLT domain-containing protein n=1 Tax=Photobacterium leiognathi TaxID=553611 RepID=UPI001EDD2CA5|nr:transglycosylase SLT domain-containing protein [Photobacterium leiognathi]MCG3884094.1 transglycosylase SLT domain-containing protein [Photobacterium leiognathi]
MASNTVRELSSSTDLSAIINAISNASDRELAAIKQISDYLNNGNKGASKSTSGEHSSPKSKNTIPKSEARLTDTLDSTISELNNFTKKVKEVNNGELKGTKSPKNRLSAITAQSERMDKKNAKSQLSTVVKQAVATAKPPANDPYSSFWKDENGRLRNASGKYASKGEQAGFAKSKFAKQEAAQEKNTTLLGKLVGYSKTAGIASANLYSSANDAANSSTADLVGGAAGGTMYYVAKELFDAANDGVNAVKGGANKVAELSEARKQKRADKLQKKQLKLAQRQEKQSKQDPVAGSALAKDKAYKRDNLEALRDQTAEDKQFHNDLLKKLDGMKASVAKASASGDSGGIIDSVIGTLAGGTGAAAAAKLIKDKLVKPKESKTPAIKEKLSEPKQSKLKSIEELASKDVKAKPSVFSRLYSEAKGKVPFLDKVGSFATKSGEAVGGVAKGVIKKLPLIGALVDGGLKANELKDRDDLSTSQKGAQVVAHTAGGWAGAAAGAATGAAIGSVVPVVGTAIGGVVGSVLGGMGGTEIGDVIGKGISDYMGSDGSISKVMDNAAENTKEAIIDGADALKESVNSLSKLFGMGSVFDTSTKKNNGNLPASTASVTYQKGDKIDQRIDKYRSKINEQAVKNGLPPELLEMLIRQESGGDANAKSDAGAAGLTQIMPDTAKELGVTNRYDPNQSIAGGAKYLGNLVKKYKKKGFNDDDAYSLALSGYNAGSGWVDAGIRSVGKKGQDMNAGNVLAAMRDPSLKIKSKGKWITRSADNIKQSDQYSAKIMTNYHAKVGKQPVIASQTHTGQKTGVDVGVSGQRSDTIQKVVSTSAIKSNAAVQDVVKERSKVAKTEKTHKPSEQQSSKNLSSSLKPTPISVNPANQPDQIKSTFDSDFMQRLTWDLN